MGTTFSPVIKMERPGTGISPTITPLPGSSLLAVHEVLSSALEDIARDHPELVVLNADTAKSCGVDKFFRAHPEHAVQMGVAEQNMVLVSAGLWTAGRIPVVTTFAAFACLRVCEQVRTSIAYPGANVKILASHAGISPGEDGVTHQCIEDLGIMRTIPNMVVVAPADAPSAVALLRQAVEHTGPVYLRYARPKTPVLYADGAPLKLGKAEILRVGTDIAFIACGPLVATALRAAEVLEQDGLSCCVVDVHTIKPLDAETICKVASLAGAVVTAEDHNIIGGLGSAVAETLAEHCPVPMGRVGVRDTFAESGRYELLLDKYGMSVERLCDTARAVFRRKR